MSADQTRPETLPGSYPRLTPHSGGHAPYPKLGPDDVDSPPIGKWSDVPVSSQPQPQHQKHAPFENPVHIDSRAPISMVTATTMPPESNPYISPSVKNKMDTVKDALGKFGKKAAEATKKAENLARSMRQHCNYKFFRRWL